MSIKENIIFLHVLICVIVKKLRKKSTTQLTLKFLTQNLIIMPDQCKQKCHVLQGVVHIVLNLHLEVSPSALYQMAGVGNVFSKHHIFTCSSAPPPSLQYFVTSPKKNCPTGSNQQSLNIYQLLSFHEYYKQTTPIQYSDEYIM